MAKLALLIGVSEYEELTFNPLPGASKDVEAMQRVLQHPEMGSFDEVKTLPNPEPLAMQEAIENLFSARAKDDLVLLFFSGHGIKDESGRLYFATRITRKNKQGELIKATAVPANFVQDIMSNSRSKRQVVILDCCFSGAFAEGWVAKDDGSVDIKNILGGEGRAVLTSSTSTQYSFEQQESELSIYTRYLVEGIETGAADQGSDGIVSVDELHEYAKKKVREAAPAMKPEIYAIKEGYKIHVAKASIGDPRLRYRKEVERFANRGEISFVGRNTLDVLRDSLSLLPEDTAAIEAEVLKPYQECKRKLLQYEQVLLEAIERENLLSEETRNDLQYLQQALGLREEDIAAIEGRVLAPKQSVSSPANTIESKESKAAIISPTQDSTSARSQEKTLVESQAKSLTSNPISNSVPIISNKKLVIGAGAIASFVLIFSFLNKPQDIPVMSNSSASPTPIVSSSTPSTSTITAKEIYDRGVDKSNQGDYKGAIEDFNQVLQLDPNFTLAYYQRGNARNEIEDYKKAIEDFSHYIRFNPNDVDAFDNRCIAYNKLNNYNLAISDCNQAIKINSKYSSAYVNRGNGYHGQGNYERAIADYNKSIEINPKSATAYYNRGNTRRRLRNYEEAIKDYNQAIYINPNYADAYFNRGLTHSILRGKQKAIADYQTAAELYQKQRDTKNYQKSLDRIKKLQQ